MPKVCRCPATIWKACNDIQLFSKEVTKVSCCQSIKKYRINYVTNYEGIAVISYEYLGFLYIFLIILTF